MSGSQLLRRYLKETGQSILGFSKKSGIDDGNLSKMLRGIRGAGLNSALKIEEATQGKVPAKSWLNGR